MSMFIRRLSCLSSLTSAMFTQRKMFSSSLAISAARVELTGTTRATTCAYSACAARPLGGFKLLDVVGRAEVLAVDELLDLVLRNVLDVGLAGIEHGHLAGIGIESRDFVPRFGEAHRQGQADVAAANDSHFELAAFEKLGFPVNGHEFRRIPLYVGPHRGQGIHVYGDATSSPDADPLEGQQSRSSDVKETSKYNKIGRAHV